MRTIKELIKDISLTVNEITATARYVNNDSRSRKNITTKSLELVSNLMDGSTELKSNFSEIVQNLVASQLGINNNSIEFKSNLEHFSDIISNLNNVKKTLNVLEKKIDNLTSIVDEIKIDTEEIFILALNASIESNKYSHDAKVFDVLAYKLNEMSNFINQNLISIGHVVDPIIEGIGRLISDNTGILDDVKKGHDNFIRFTGILDKQKNSIDELLLKNNISGAKIDDQQMKLEEISEKVNQMDRDADEAIKGSGNVIKSGENLGGVITGVISEWDDGNNYLEKIDFVHDQSSSISQNAQNVNKKSKSQLEFSVSCVSFCDSIIAESFELQKTTKTVEEQSVKNNKMAESMSRKLGHLTTQLSTIQNRISESNKTIHTFNENYEQINNIINFLKSILKSMKVIAMYSRIEASRDPKEFEGFMTIYKNINNLQNHIQKNIPLVDDNISKTHKLIEKINIYFKEIFSVFLTISKNSNRIIEKIEEVTSVSAGSKSVSETIVKESKEIDALLNDLRKFLLELSEVVKKPIEGSSGNIERGKKIENQCLEIKQVVNNEM